MSAEEGSLAHARAQTNATRSHRTAGRPLALRRASPQSRPRTGGMPLRWATRRSPQRCPAATGSQSAATAPWPVSRPRS
eukprot:15096727-Alexandrium_andersonii.AAC.2